MPKRHVSYKGQDFEIAYDVHNKEFTKSIVFLHGWGSSKELMQGAFKTCFTDYKHFYLDLPGFGKSPNRIFLTPEDYAHIVDAFFESWSIEPCIALGHSFGGKVATLCQSQNLILLSTAGILLPKPLKTRLKIKLAKCCKALGIRFNALRSADARDLSPVMYEILKFSVQEDFSPAFSACTKKTLILWGKQDRATPLLAGERVASLIANNQFEVLEGDHFFFLKQGALVDRYSCAYFKGA
ncbi:alpha/beta fold hydrolase [Helicobacter cynogastricus]|uniref:alpha/beta fold hydrolase n=1 Tax=Helicobacter cynogastricus TaxID=329937 RepID=UPI000CF02FAF|nr:alpha/beta hydrolase [Helicobacter cynogastricus]